MKKSQTALLIGGGLIIILLLGLLVFLPEKSDTPTPTETPDTATSTDDIVIGEDGGTIDGGTIEVITPEKPTPIQTPSLDREVVIPDVFQGEAAQLMATRVADAIAAVKENPDSFGDWLTLSNIRHQIQDYTGEVEILEYLIETGTSSSIPYSNLGNVYHYHTPNYPKAEENYLAAIKINPGNEIAYKELHTMYKNVYKTDTTNAVDILLQGLEQKPYSTDFMVMLGTYYKDKGDTENQLVYFEQALNEAKRVNNTALVNALEAEISALK